MNNQVFAPAQPGASVPTNRPKDWFSYPIVFESLTEGDVRTLTFQIDAGSDFYLTAMTQFSVLSGSTSVQTSGSYIVPAATILLTDTGSNRQLMNQAAPLASIAGDGNHPHRLIHPRLFLRNSMIQVLFTLLATDASASYDSVTINFEGFRIYG